MSTIQLIGNTGCDKRCELDEDAKEEYECVSCPGKQTPNPDPHVSRTILEQLGGRHFLAMTGAKDLLGSSDSLMFSLPSGFAKDGINKVKIRLHQTDTYIVEAMRLDPAVCKIIERMDFVYAEDLQRIFTRLTGLDTHL
jgi:hypothetical protein